MFKLRCKVLDIGNCDYAAEGHTEADAINNSKAHLMAAHTDAMREIYRTLSLDEIQEKLQTAVHNS